MVDYTKASGAVVDAQGRSQFADRNDALGVQGTYLDAADRNQDRNTLVSAVIASGQTPDATKDDQLTVSIQAAGIPLWSQSVAAEIKGYPLGMVVRDASPQYWISTKDENLTVPGQDGADWVDFFAATMTPAQAKAQFVQSVPAAGQTRITDLVENADGRAVFGDGTNNPVLALLSDLPMDDPAMKLQAFYVTPNYNLGANNPIRVSFPRAFKPGTVPVVMIPNTQEMGMHEYWISNVIAGNSVNGATTELLVDNEGFSIGGYVIGAGIEGKAGTSMIIPVFAAGYYA
ncbi:hypothetical protein [Acetobacter sp.]|uniref:hypothetical protein n=1 Tax=Acetobacter sp. TaxID=440 RepID=UPI0039EAA291